MLSQSKVLGRHPGDQALRELPSPGKSGSVFFLSHDDKYVIKTMRRVSPLQFYAADNVRCFVTEAIGLARGPVMPLHENDWEAGVCRVK